MEVIMTLHAYDRMKERFSYNRNAARRMAVKALEKGISVDDANGKLRSYMDHKHEMYDAAGDREYRIHGEAMYCYAKSADDQYHLLTAFTIPQEYRKPAIRQQKRHHRVTKPIRKQAAV